MEQLRAFSCGSPFQIFFLKPYSLRNSVMVAAGHGSRLVHNSRRTIQSQTRFSRWLVFPAQRSVRQQLFSHKKSSKHFPGHFQFHVFASFFTPPLDVSRKTREKKLFHSPPPSSHQFFISLFAKPNFSRNFFSLKRKMEPFFLFEIFLYFN